MPTVTAFSIPSRMEMTRECLDAASKQLAFALAFVTEPEPTPEWEACMQAFHFAALARRAVALPADRGRIE